MGLGKVLLPLFHPVWAFKEVKLVEPSEKKKSNPTAIMTKLASKFRKRHAQGPTTPTDQVLKQATTTDVAMPPTIPKEDYEDFTISFSNFTAPEQSHDMSTVSLPLSTVFEKSCSASVVSLPDGIELSEIDSTPKLSPIVASLEQALEEIISLYSSSLDGNSISSEPGNQKRDSELYDISVVDHPNIAELPEIESTPTSSLVVVNLEQIPSGSSVVHSHHSEEAAIKSDNRRQRNDSELFASNRGLTAAHALSSQANKFELKAIPFEFCSAEVAAPTAYRPSLEPKYDSLFSYLEPLTTSGPVAEAIQYEEWYTNNVPALPRPGKTYTEQQVSDWIRSNRDELLDARNENSSLRERLRVVEIECSHADQTIASANSTIATLQDDVRRLENQYELDGILLRDGLFGDPLRQLQDEVRMLRSQHEFDSTLLRDALYGPILDQTRHQVTKLYEHYQHVQRENRGLCAELQQLRAQSILSTADKERQNPVTARLMLEGNNARNRAHVLQTERDSVRIELSMTRRELAAARQELKDAKGKSSSETDLKKRESQLKKEKEYV